MNPTPYVLPASYSVLTGNHNPPVVDAAGNTFWPLNVKRGGPLYFAVFLQGAAGEAQEVLTFPGAGQGAIFFYGQDLWASAFHSPDDAVSSPFVGRVEEYIPFPPPPDAAALLTTIIARLADPASNVAKAVAAAVAAALTRK